LAFGFVKAPLDGTKFTLHFLRRRGLVVLYGIRATPKPTDALGQAVPYQTQVTQLQEHLQFFGQLPKLGGGAVAPVGLRPAD
jgi:hypothetical protein